MKEKKAITRELSKRYKYVEQKNYSVVRKYAGYFRYMIGRKNFRF